MKKFRFDFRGALTLLGGIYKRLTGKKAGFPQDNSRGSIYWEDKRIHKSIIEYAQNRIQTRTEINGKPFTALALSTIERKGFDQPLVETGKMSRASSFRFTVKGNTLEVTNIAPYSSVHQFGSKKVPRRSFIGRPPELNALIVSILLGN